VVPIFVDDAFVGSVGAYGFILDDGEVDSFMVNKTIDMDEEEIEALSEDIKSISTESAEDFAQYINERIAAIIGDYKG